MRQLVFSLAVSIALAVALGSMAVEEANIALAKNARWVQAQARGSGEEAVTPVGMEASASGTAGGQKWAYPIAPGIWYPGDGPLPEHPVRYYRIRCWPGCHRGSPYGKYPDRDLGMKPIFPTSTVPGRAQMRHLQPKSQP
ncbi:MAG: hypothetical protein JRJ12_01985 [Deltaproteobacteria bacterium]|nr:hypothetical protein [Deltaproteobacteria bacterium]